VLVGFFYSVTLRYVIICIILVYIYLISIETKFSDPNGALVKNVYTPALVNKGK
jgi:hypothetical protein